MKYVMMIATAIVLVASGANALTLKSGEVLTSDGTVAKASETKTGKNKLAQDGVYIAGGVVFIDLNGTTVEVPVNEIAGKSKDQIIAVIGEHAVEQMQDLYDDAEAHAAAVGGVNAVGKSVEQIVDEALSNGNAEGAIVGVSESLHEQIKSKFAEIDGVEKIYSEQELLDMGIDPTKPQ